jgi:hypothetical protein
LCCAAAASHHFTAAQHNGPAVSLTALARAAPRCTMSLPQCARRRAPVARHPRSPLSVVSQRRHALTALSRRSAPMHSVARERRAGRRRGAMRPARRKRTARSAPMKTATQASFAATALFRHRRALRPDAEVDGAPASG